MVQRCFNLTSIFSMCFSASRFLKSKWCKGIRIYLYCILNEKSRRLRKNSQDYGIALTITKYLAVPRKSDYVQCTDFLIPGVNFIESLKCLSEIMVAKLVMNLSCIELYLLLHFLTGKMAVDIRCPST